MLAKLLTAIFLSLIATAGAMAGAALVVAKLPANHFVSEREEAPEGSGINRVVRNIVGAALILAGFVMILIPGPGLLTLLIGLTLTTFPGKRKIERSLASNPKILSSINGLRSKCGKEPMLPPARAVF